KPQVLALPGRNRFSSSVAFSSTRQNVFSSDAANWRRSKPARNVRAASTTPLSPWPRTVGVSMATWATLLWIFASGGNMLHLLHADRLQVARHLDVELPGRHRLLVQHLPQGLRHARRLERRPVSRQ